MKLKMQILVTICALFPLASMEGCGSVRARMRDRFVEKQSKKPEPESLPAPDKITAPGDYPLSILVGEERRFYKIHVPAKYDAKSAAPLLFVLHGGGGNMDIQSNDEFYKQISKGEQEGFIAIFPNGSSRFRSGELATWNAGRCCGFGRDSQKDDVEFIRQILKKTQSQLSIDPNRIFATGMSNGGMMAYRLACEMSDVFKAIASVAGTDNTVVCKPSKPLSVLHIHARDDDHVLFEGGAGKDAFKDRSQVTDFISVPATIKKWRDIDGCTTPPKRTLETAGAYCEVTTCASGSRVQLCVTESGGHSWPGGKKPRRAATATPSTALSANDVMWEFFKGL